MQLANAEAIGERVAVLFTDANFARYGVSASQISSILDLQSSVRVYLIVIGKHGFRRRLVVCNRRLVGTDVTGTNSAILNSLPAGRCFHCQDLQELPRIFTQILQSNVV